MKTSRLHFAILLIAAVVLSATATAQNVKEKKFSKTWNSSEEITINIVNEYGDVNLKTWNKNEVGVEVTIQVENYPESKADMYLENININASEQNKTITVKTEINDKIRKAIGSQNGKKKIRISYQISHPVYQKFIINNNYGNISIEELSGKSTINLKYGNLNAGNMIFDDTKPFTTLDISFGNAKINKTTWMQFVVNYSNVEIAEATALIFISKYSNITGGNIHSVVSNSKYDNYKISSARNFIVESKYSNVTIGDLSKQLHATMEYGTVKVRNVPAGFEKIKIDAKYTDCEIIIDENACYQISGEVVYGSIKVPLKANITRKKDSMTEAVNGWVGCKEGSASVTEIKGKYGDFRFTK
jgi:hypothetical protein